jgi:hypothetical protein
MSIVMVGSTSGSITLQEPAVAGSNTINLPAATGTAVLDTATQTLTNKTLTTPNIDSAQFATVSGTAPIYPCRAWVNFNGTGTVAIRASGNVSSLTDNGVGNYTINFTTAMPDANYAPFYCDNSWGNGFADVLATGSYRVICLNNSFNNQDNAFIFSGILR